MENAIAGQLFDKLRSNSGKLWVHAQDHPFVHALADGSLGIDRFTFYLQQDYVYLIAYARAISIAAAKAPGLASMGEFTALAHETINVEMQLHRGYCTEFGISDADLTATEASPICQAYSDFCISTASTYGCLELLCALSPCGVGYAEIGTRLKAIAQVNANPFHRWVETYASEGYQQYARWMVEKTNELGRQPHILGELTRLFNLGCRYEWLFWEMAWRQDAWPL